MSEVRNGEEPPSLPLSRQDEGDSGPVHRHRTMAGWRDLLNEIVVIVIGVLIALGAQQLVDTIAWRQKVAVAEESIRAELGNNLALAMEQKLLNGCVNRYLDTLQQAVTVDDAATIRKLAEMGAPLVGRAWPRDTWTAALNSEVPDHLGANQVTSYSRAFLRIGVQREFMQQMEDLYPQALSGGFGLPRDAGVANQQLVAILRLKRLEATRLMISNSLLQVDGPSVSARASTQYLASDRAYVRTCAIKLRQVQAVAGR